MRHLLLAFVIVSALAVCSHAAAQRPNIVVILADDFGYSDLGCYGSEIATPNIDKLAAAGVRFTQFYNAARCCPTRAALLTGLYPHQAEMGWMAGNPRPTPGYTAELSQQAVTIPEILRTAGYATYMTGKWHVTSQLKPDGPRDNWPMQRGFDRFYGTIQGGGSYYDPALLCRDNTPITPEGDPEYKPARFYYTDAISDQSVRFIQDHHQTAAEKPLFMYVAYTAPHWPMHAMEASIARYKGKYDAGYTPIRAARFERMQQMGIIDPKWKLTGQAWKWEDQPNKPWEARCMEVYAAMTERMDHGVGQIVEALKQTGSLDNTLILFLGDNGACAEKMGRERNAVREKAPATQPRSPDAIQTMVYPKHTPDGRPIRQGPEVVPGGGDTFIAYGEGWANVSNTPLREYKHFVHEGGIATPLVAHWPKGVTRRGEVERQPGHVIDLMTTFVELAGATYPAEKSGHAVPAMAGVSLVPALNGKPLERKAPIFWEHESNRAVRDGQWKLVAKGARGPWELYDMEVDRTEMHDLAAQQPERVKTMAAQWQQWAENNKVLPLGAWEKPKKGAAADQS